jgi:hypothetical protein
VFGLNNPIDRKRPTHLHLTIPAVTGMDKHGLGREGKLHGAAEAGAIGYQRHLHDYSVPH